MTEPELTHREQALLYRNGNLTTEEKRAFEAHLETCAECQRALAQKPKRPVDAKAEALAEKRAAEEAVERRVRRVRVGLQLAAAVSMVILAAIVVQRLQRANGWPLPTPQLAPDGGR